MFLLTQYSDAELAVIADEVRREQIRRTSGSSICVWCGGEFFARAGAKFCSSAHRVAHHRAGIDVPRELAGLHRWVRHSRKRPIRPDGTPASSTDSSTWSSLAAAKASKVGDGLGFVLNGDGIGCYDFDHCVVAGVVSAQALGFIEQLDAFYVEISPSGTGVHAWVYADAQPGYRKVIDGLNVEFYTQGRYLTVTGRRI